MLCCYIKHRGIKYLYIVCYTIYRARHKKFLFFETPSINNIDILIPQPLALNRHLLRTRHSPLATHRTTHVAHRTTPHPQNILTKYYEVLYSLHIAYNIPMTTLDTAKQVVTFLNSYRGPMELNALLDACPVAREDAIATFDFINSIKPLTLQPQITHSLTPIDTSKPLDLMDELHYTYQVAKRLLTDELSKGVHDTEEVRKNLREISRFMESALKMQEKLANVQQIQRFQEAVYSLLDTIDPTLRQQVITALLENEI